MTTKLYFDESGYTGRQLLDPLQRHFVLASSTVGDDIALDLMRTSFPDYQGAEFKFEKIWAKPTSRRRLPIFVEAVGTHAVEFYVWSIDKRYSLLIKMLEYLMEPALYEAGYDWYSGYGYGLSNYVQFGLTRMAPDGLYEATLRAYLEFARKPSDEGRFALMAEFQTLKRKAPEEIQFVYDACISGLADFHRYHEFEGYRNTLEIYVTSMLNAVGYWANRGLTDLELNHDESSGFFRSADMWAAMTSSAVGARVQPVLNGPPITFPLPVKATVSRRSQESAGVQLCDLMAGLSAKMFAGRLQDEPGLLDVMRSSGFAQIDGNGVGPSDVFPEGPPPRRNGKDAVDRMVDLIRAGSGRAE